MDFERMRPERGEGLPEEDIAGAAAADGEGAALEKERPLDIGFYVTDHNLRYDDRSSPERQRRLYAEMKEHGLSAIRFDMDWKEMMPDAEGAPRKEMMERYAEAMRLMKEEGLEEPTVVVSNPPPWAEELYKKGDKDAYFEAFGNYLASVADTLRESGVKVHAAQLFNEVNHANLFHYADTEDLPRLARMVRETLGEVQPDIKVSTSIIVANFSDAFPGPMRAKDRPPLDEFMEKYADVLKEFDSVSVDYYPGVWHMPLRSAGFKWKDTYKQIGPLKKVCETIASWGKEYEIGESGFPTVAGASEDRQRYFYDTYFRAFRQMLVDFRSRGVSLPRRVGLFETEDEPNSSFGGPLEKILGSEGVQKVVNAVNPEHHWGLKKDEHTPKEVLKGNRHRRKGDGEEVIGLHLGDPKEASQLGKIIRYVKRPIREDEVSQAEGE